MRIRVGFGFDVHKFAENRELWLGGIQLEHDRGLLGHSDADVLIHAICDALLGAAHMRDIGYHFPDNAGEYKNIDSKILLSRTVALIASKGYRVGNIDATVCAERPKLKAHIPLMQQTLADVMAYRAPLYERYADLIVDCPDGQTLEQTVQQVIDRLREQEQSRQTPARRV